MKAPSGSLARSWRWLVRSAALAGLYFALARLGHVAMAAEESVSPVWPAAGLAVAALWWGGYRLAPAIGLGAFTTAWLGGATLPASAAAAIAAMVEPILAVLVMRRYIGGPALFDRVGDALCFVLVAVATPALVDALRVAALSWSGVMPWQGYSELWLLSWVGNSVGTLIVAPALLVWTWPDRMHWTERRRIEAAAGFALLTICSGLVFTGRLAPAGVGFPFLVLPVLVWIAFRFGERATVSATLLACAFAIWGTRLGMGPFAELETSLPVLQLFAGTVAITGLMLVVGVTERRQAESALRRSEERMRLLLESVRGYAIYSLDPEGRIATWSAEAERIKGFRADEIIGKPFGTFFTPEDIRDGVPERVLRTAAEQGHAGYEGLRVRKDGSRFWVEGIVTAMRDEDGKLSGFSKVAHDVTERRRLDDLRRRISEVLETRVEERTAQLKASLKSVEELLYTIAHDLRAPNRHIQGFAQVLQMTYANQLDDTARDYLSRIEAVAIRNDELIRDLLKYGRLSHEAIELEPVDTRQTVKTVLQTLAEEVQQRRARVHYGEELPHVLGNERLLEQVLTNLMTNALTYVPPGREPEILISGESEGGKAVLRVQDNGIGIPPEHIDRVFEPFIRLPNPTNAPGTGMGLAIVKKAAERLNGAVGADSTPGKGSCFWLELRAA
jgi:PAS domain S-box-containing protein